ncbi:MAG: hypothetical protein L3J22_08680 [Xanthomonadales bacterium]|nr:hypothetical protein [Xanthomonadales bacterium]
MSSCRILPIFTFTVNEWLQQSVEILNRISNQFDQEELIVRSSSTEEDCRYLSNAGAFKSILNVSAQSESALHNAIQQVIDSMPGTGKDEVLIQPMVTNFLYAGVASTHCLVHESPYYTIEYSSKDTFSATAGRGNTHCVYHVRSALDQQLCMPELQPVLITLKELESLNNEDTPLEIEWALDDSGIVLFQVRALKLKANKPCPEILKNVHASLLLKSQPDACGAPIYSCMSDWNPAELLGRRPRPLALSLFSHIISQSNWYKSRQAMGYQSIYKQNLAVNFGGFVYIDARASFASLIPNSLAKKDANSLVQAWLGRLKSSPELHDKVEFDIVQSCYIPGLLDSLESRYPGVLSPASQLSWQLGLKEITVNAIHQNKQSGLPLAKRILENLEQNWLIQAASSKDTEASFFLEQSKVGGFAFSIFARCAFIAEEWIRSLVSTGVLSEARSNQLRQSVGTITNRLIDASTRLRNGLLDPQTWSLEFGYLRPSNFDICSLPINAADITRQSKSTIAHTGNSAFQLSAVEDRKITALLNSHKLAISPPVSG